MKEPSSLVRWRFLWDLPLWSLMVLYCVLCPWTKVEESFNVQAAHDILYLTPTPFKSSSLENFDHVHFPGVVPRTFVGPCLFAIALSPIRLLSSLFGLDTGNEKIAMLFCFRVILGTCVVWSLGSLRRAAETHLVPALSRTTFRSAFVVLSCSQFHLLFYASRPLPNTMSLVLCTWAMGLLLDPWPRASHIHAVWLLALATIVFRCDTIVLAIPLILMMILSGRLRGWTWILSTVAFCGVVIVVTILVDSYFWGRWVWPELEVLLFNTVQNNSSLWGTSPWHWYFSSALPKSLLLAYPLSLVGLLKIPTFSARLKPNQQCSTETSCISGFEARGVVLLLPVLAFVALYSFLPHKELRFIFPALPVFNALAARGVCVMLTPSTRSPTTLTVSRYGPRMFRFFVRWGLRLGILVSGLIVLVSLACSMLNYPGGEAIRALNSYHYSTVQEPRVVRVHIGNLAATTGVSRFHEWGCTTSAGCLLHVKTEGLDHDSARLHSFQESLPEDVCYILTEHPMVPGFSILSDEPRYGGRIPAFQQIAPRQELISAILRILDFDFDSVNLRSLIRTHPGILIMKRHKSPQCP